MSSFQLNLSSLALGAKDCLAHLEASTGGTLHAHLLSLAPGSAMGPVLGIALICFPAALDVEATGVSPLVRVGGHDATGEFLCPGGLSAASLLL